MKKKLAGIIAVAMVAVMLAACGIIGTEPLDPWYEPERPTTAGFTETISGFGGRNIHIVTANYWLFNYGLNPDETPNETLAIMRQMRNIEDDYNITFTFEPLPAGAGIRDNMIASRMVGDTPYDLVNMDLTHTNIRQFIQHELFLPVDHPSVRAVIGLDAQPWAEAGRLTTFGTNQYGVHFLMANGGTTLHSVLTFNRDFMHSFDVGNFYEMMFNMEWTWDAFETAGRSIMQQSNNTITSLIVGRELYFVPAFMKSNGGYVVRQTVTGFDFVGYENDAFLETLEFLARLNQEGMIIEDSENVATRAAAGEALFISGTYEYLRAFTRGEIQTPYSWGLLPIPMGPRMNDYVAAQFTADIWFIPNGIAAPYEVATVLVAMANRLSKINIIETELEYGLLDYESIQVMEMLLDRIVIDYSRSLADTRVNLTREINTVFAGTVTPVVAMQRIGHPVQSALNQFLPFICRNCSYCLLLR